jgi:hypothetical protein
MHQTFTIGPVKAAGPTCKIWRRIWRVLGIDDAGSAQCAQRVGAAVGMRARMTAVGATSPSAGVSAKVSINPQRTLASVRNQGSSCAVSDLHCFWGNVTETGSAGGPAG